MKRTIWRPLLLGIIMGLLGGMAVVAGLTFIAAGITDNAIGIYAIMLLLAAALGGPLAGFIAGAVLLILSATVGPLEVREILGDSPTFWSNLLAVSTSAALVGVAYRFAAERVEMPTRLLPWAVIVFLYYVVSVPASITPQYVIHRDPATEILPAIWEAYTTFLPQALFDILFTSLVFLALPASMARPLWYEPRALPGRAGGRLHD